jgi:hypothetical protein
VSDNRESGKNRAPPNPFDEPKLFFGQRIGDGKRFCVKVSAL